MDVRPTVSSDTILGAVDLSTCRVASTEIMTAELLNQRATECITGIEKLSSAAEIKIRRCTARAVRSQCAHSTVAKHRGVFASYGVVLTLRRR